MLSSFVRPFRQLPLWIWLLLFLLFDAILSIVIVLKVPYTEIDWLAYMDEVGGVLNGEFDYTRLGGSTGPLVYPAGFIYIYAAMSHVTGRGVDIRLAQWIFVGLYLVYMVTVFTMMILFYYYYSYAPKHRGRGKGGSSKFGILGMLQSPMEWKIHRSGLLPLWMVALMLILSRRIHSIFMLRLFNDCYAMLFAYLGVVMSQCRYWAAASIMFSLGLSIKMNVMLFFPALLWMIFAERGWKGVFENVAVMITLQILLGAPFLATYPRSYLSRAFEFSRVFIYKWTVNWKMVPESVFLHPWFSLVLLSAHLILLFIFAHWKYCRKWKGVWNALWLISFRTSRDRLRKIRVPYITMTLLTCNYIGIVVSRTLHYQFYVWYYHSIPILLAASTSLSWILRLVLWIGMEICWNIFPSNPLMSAVLLCVHVVILYGSWKSIVWLDENKPCESIHQQEKEKEKMKEQ